MTPEERLRNPEEGLRNPEEDAKDFPDRHRACETALSNDRS
jgi:hypothetical protein